MPSCQKSLGARRSGIHRGRAEASPGGALRGTRWRRSVSSEHNFRHRMTESSTIVDWEQSFSPVVSTVYSTSFSFHRHKHKITTPGRHGAQGSAELHAFVAKKTVHPNTNRVRWFTACNSLGVMRCHLLAALVTLTASFASTPSPSPCDREAMATDASGEYSCGARIEWLKSNDGLTDWWAHEQVAQESPNPNLTQP